MRDATKIIRSTLTPAVAGEPLNPGRCFAAPYHASGDPSNTPYTYARAHNPHGPRSRKSSGQMESGRLASGESYEASALVFASGMAACTAVSEPYCGRATSSCCLQTLITRHASCYRSTSRRWGVVLRMAPTAGNAQAELLEGARLLWLESPSNPGMEICDIAMLSEAAHHAGALVAVDNTTPTPLGQLPLALGADFSVASDTKAMTGHSDLLIGHVAMRDRELHAKIDQWRTLTGAALGPMEAWLALRSIATLPLRLERSCDNAQRIAEFLATRSEVSSVLYPGLPTHPVTMLQ